MNNLSGAYDIIERVNDLEHKVKQLEVTVKVLWEVIDKLRLVIAH
jgi:hypothetical protein